MRVTIAEARESPVAAAIFLVGVAAAGVAVVFSDGDFGAAPGTPTFLVGAGVAALAVLLTVASRFRS